jgi:DNA-3-methyladenine glycosylase
MGRRDSSVIVDRDRLAVTSLRLAPRLLGAVLASDVGGQRVAVRLTEVEAYEGSADPASHAYRGSTPRTAVMFGPAGYLYCYFTYGMHWCANIVCGVDGVASAVLLRAGEIVEGADFAATRRPASRSTRDLARGPARLAAALGLARATDGVDLCSPNSLARLVSMPTRAARGIEAGPRVGISVATERPWRFWLPSEPTVSTFKAGRVGRANPVEARRQT